MADDLLLELGAEELPASFIGPALEELKRTVVTKLDEARLKHGEARTFGTPRRLAVLLRDVASRGEDLTREVLGPSVRASFDKDGKPTRAAEKFAESQKVSVDALRRVQTSKGEYLGTLVEEKGRAALEILKEVLFQAVHGLRFPKSMRWGDVDLPFARPLHWIVALYGSEVIPVVYADVRSGRTTMGHRFLSPGPIDVATPADYEPALKRASVLPDIAERRAQVLERVRAAASQTGGQLLEDPALLEQVTNLVELPMPVVGTFDPRHLDLPPEVLVQEMKSHQRYFSVVDAQGKLLPRFIAVSNTAVRDVQRSLRGYERVLKARLSDGRFFFDEDRKTPLADRGDRLKRVVWQNRLGTYADKVERFRALALWLCERTARGHRATIERASTLSKADLVTGMVGEFPELQGVMGREYARASGEPAEVSLAIFEHYLPRSAADVLPTQDAGALIGIADRLDTLCGLFAIDKVPSGAADPFGLRRAALGVISIVLGRGYRFSLGEALSFGLEQYPAEVFGKAGAASPLPLREATRSKLLEFFRNRLKALWTEQHRADVVEAVLAVGFDGLVTAGMRLDALSQWVGRPDFAPLAGTFKRVMNIVQKQGKDVTAGKTDAALFAEDAERALHADFGRASARVDELIRGDDYVGALREITSLKPTVDRFFEQVMVMAEDRSVRDNRIRLLIDVGSLFERVADFSKIQAETA